MIRRRTALAATAATTLAGLVPAAWAQGRKDSLVLAMTLEPPGLDPTAGAASAIAEVVQYNLLETLTKIRADSTIAPLLATSWTVTPPRSMVSPSRSFTIAFLVWGRRPIDWPTRRALPRAFDVQTPVTFTPKRRLPKPTLKTRTRTPQALATRKWPSSWSAMRSVMVRSAPSTPLKESIATT